MGKTRWRIVVNWPGEPQAVEEFMDTHDLKVYLDSEVFCVEHGCPLPELVTIQRMSD